MVSYQSSINTNLQRVDITLDKVAGNFDISMGLWTDETFSTPINGVANINVPEKIFAAVMLDSSAPAEFHIQMKRCWATPR
jgi:hypothetical protein